jgi:AraC-like DNA-binding protein
MTGGFTGRWAGRSAECLPGTLISELAGERHDNVFDPRSGARVVAVQPESELRGLESPAWRRSGPRPEALPIAWRMGQELARPDTATPMALEGLALELCAVALRDAAPRIGQATLANRAREIVEERYAQPIGLSDVANELAVHPGSLARAFRQQHGRSLGTFLREVRVRRAAERLVRSTESIAEVALAVGFADQSHLTRWFLPHVGVTPARYRSIVRQD